MIKDFDLFMSQLSQTNRTLDYFCDFDKITANVERIKLHLCMLNSLIGTDDLRKSVGEIWEVDKSAFQVLGLLIAVRSSAKELVIGEDGGIVPLKSFFNTEEGVLLFLQETGLGAILVEQKVTNLVDYVFGIETGLDTNARKNRTGTIMERIVAKRLADAGITFREQQSAKHWEEIKVALGTDQKLFDFVIETKENTYFIEVNFYNSSGGSKLSEVCRSYSDIAPKINAVNGFNFVWITDGVGWHSARNILNEAYNSIPLVYNLTSFDAFIERLKSEGA